MPDDSPTAEIAIVTGGSSGIGRAAALRLAQDGYDIGLTYGANREGAEETAHRIREIGRRVHYRQMEQTDPASIRTALTELAEELGGLNVFVCNAGTLAFGNVLELDETEWKRVIDCNLTGSFVAGKVIAGIMVQAGTGGRIVNLSSVHEAIPLLGGSAYCASKAGVGMLTKCMALDLAPHGIRVNAVGPGETATPMIGVGEGADIHAIARPDVPAGRPGTPEEMAEAIAYLASPNSAFTNGTTLFVDGGLSLMAAIPNQRAIMEGMTKD